ncbi:MAG: glutathione S-transferase family protein [Alphaproteobacteria bacterium]|nr:glutathione S-transferase family protein [Alphaproteobacteria bacterium]
MSLVIHAFPQSPRNFKVLAVANHLGLDYRYHQIDLLKGAQKSPEFMALNPNGRAPVIEDDGFVLWESNAILQYLATKKPQAGLMPMHEKGRADVTRWLFWDSCHWDPACIPFIFENILKALRGMGAPDAAKLGEAEPKFAQAAAILEAQLASQKFVCGDSLTLADFALAAPLNLTGEAKYPLGPYAAIKRWYGEVSSLPAWRRTSADHLAVAA